MLFGKKTLITLITIVLLFLLSFFVWHFFLSIYEVKYKFPFNEAEVKCNSEISIQTAGINSFGWELPFRKIRSKVKITEGNDLIKLTQKGNFIIIKTLGKEGKFVIEVLPEFSLNPTEFAIRIVNMKE